MTARALSVSPYLMRPLRSYAQAIHDREIERSHWAPRDQPAEGVDGPARDAAAETGTGTAPEPDR